MLPIPAPDPQSNLPLYRQIYASIRDLIESGRLENGYRLPPTRELAGWLGLNRTTISAAYELLETEGFISGQVGRGSFVSVPRNTTALDWDAIMGPAATAPSAATTVSISFASSRPSELLFPIDDFRSACMEVVESADAHTILQLGSSAGYPPLRRYLLEQARQEGTAANDDDIVITSGCQQALDLLARMLGSGGEAILIEDPVYPGLHNAFRRAGARILPVAVGDDGLQLDALQRAIAVSRPRAIVVTPAFQNPTGCTMPLEARRALLLMARAAGVIVIENDTYGQLRYEGDPLPTLKELDGGRNVVLLRSFSKLAFPGLRVGWTVGPRRLIERLTEAKHWTDLHSDHLSQAVLLRFAESGRLARYREHVLAAGRERLQAVLAACEKHLPRGSRWTRPRGGMNLWVRLPEPLDAAELLPRAERAGVTYLPGRFFSVGIADPGSFRISFAGVEPDRIETGLAALGKVFRDELARARSRSSLESAAIV